MENSQVRTNRFNQTLVSFSRQTNEFRQANSVNICKFNTFDKLAVFEKINNNKKKLTSLTCMLNMFLPISVLVKHNVDDEIFRKHVGVANDSDHDQLNHIEDDESDQVLLDQVYPLFIIENKSFFSNRKKDIR